MYILSLIIHVPSRRSLSAMKLRIIDFDKLTDVLIISVVQ